MGLDLREKLNIRYIGCKKKKKIEMPKYIT